MIVYRVDETICCDTSCDQERIIFDAFCDALVTEAVDEALQTLEEYGYQDAAELIRNIHYTTDD